MIVLKMFYYSFAFLFALWSLYKISETKTVLKFTKDVKDNSERDKEDRDKEIVNKSCFYGVFGITNFFWLLSGLFTFNYEFIIVGYLGSFILGKIFFSRSSIDGIGNIIYTKIISFVWVLFYMFLVINSFHLHIQLNLVDYIKNLL